MTTPTLQRDRTFTDDDAGYACRSRQATLYAHWERS